MLITIFSIFDTCTLKVHVHPSSIACLWFCFKTLLLSNSVFWLGRAFAFFTLGRRLTLQTLKMAIFSWTKSFFWSTGYAKLHGWTWVFKRTTVKPVYNSTVYTGSGQPVYYGHRKTSQNFQLPYVFYKVDLYIAVTLFITVTLPCPKGDRCTHVWLYVTKKWHFWVNSALKSLLIFYHVYPYTKCSHRVNGMNN